MYSSRITRRNPTAFMILIDQSGSMDEKMRFGDSVTTKAVAVSTITNDLISELINRSRREDGVAGYFDIAVYGYGGGGVNPMLGGGGFINIAQVASLDIPVKESTMERILDDGRSLMTVRRERQWIAPISSGGTPMLEALNMACRLLHKWCGRPEHRNGYPPVVFNITDGEATDANEQKLIDAAAAIKEIATEDGNVLLFNIHIASGEADVPLLFPSDKSLLPGQRYASMLYDMSSVLPDSYCRSGGSLFRPGGGGYRAMSYNAGATQVLAMIDIGSVTVK